MKRKLSKLIALALAAVMLLSSASVLAEPFAAYGGAAAGSQPAGINSTPGIAGAGAFSGKTEPERRSGAEMSAVPYDELTELDLALNAEGSQLHFEVVEGDCRPAYWAESEEIEAIWGQRTVGQFMTLGHPHTPTIKTTVTVNAGDSIVYDLYVGDWLFLKVDGVVVSSYGGAAYKHNWSSPLTRYIGTGYYTFPQAGTYELSFVYDRQISWDSQAPGDALGLWLDEISIQSDIINHEISAVLGLPVITLGRASEWEAFNWGNMYPKVSLPDVYDQGMTYNIYEDTYIANLSVCAYMTEGETFEADITSQDYFGYSGTQGGNGGFFEAIEFSDDYDSPDDYLIFDFTDLSDVSFDAASIITEPEWLYTFSYAAPRAGWYQLTFKILMLRGIRFADFGFHAFRLSGNAAEQADPYLSAALNVEGAELPMEFYTFDNLPGSEFYYMTHEATPYAGTVIDGRYAAVNERNYRLIASNYDEFPSAVGATAFMSAGSQLSFDYRVSSEDVDVLSFYINGEPDEAFDDGQVGTFMPGRSGSTGWQTYIWTAPEDGDYTFRWQYAKDSWISVGYDSAWLDNVERIGVVLPDVGLSELAQAMNAPGCMIDYVNDSEYPWIADTIDGMTAGRSTNNGQNPDETTSYIAAEVEMTAGQTLSFDYLVMGCEQEDFFNFYANDEQLITAEAETVEGWQSYTYTAEASGTVNFMWEFWRDERVYAGDCFVYVKNVELNSAKAVTRSELSEAMNAPGCSLEYENDSEFPWTADTIDGMTAGRSTNNGQNPDETTSYITATVNMTEGQTLSFDYLVMGCEQEDFFNFYANDEQLLTVEAETVEGWQNYTYTAETSGAVNFMWEFWRDERVYAGDCFVYVKNVALSSAADDLSELAQAMNAPGCILEYENDEEHPWVVAQYNGEPVGKSGNTGMNVIGTTSSVEATAYLKAGQTLSFDYLMHGFDDYVGSHRDTFSFFANGTIQLFDYGIHAWQSYTYTADRNGFVTFRWSFNRAYGDFAQDGSYVMVKNVYCDGALEGGNAPEGWDYELGEAVCSAVPVLFKNGPDAVWHAEDGFMQANENAYAETRLYFLEGAELSFDYELSGGALNIRLSREGVELEVLSGHGATNGWTAVSYTVETAAVYTLSFEFEGSSSQRNAARVRSLEFTNKHMDEEPSDPAELNAALNYEGGELDFITEGDFRFTAAAEDETGRYYATATNAQALGTECSVSTTVWLDGDHGVTFDVINLGFLGNSVDDTWDHYEASIGALQVTGDNFFSYRLFDFGGVFVTYSFHVDVPGYYTLKWIYNRGFFTTDPETEYGFCLDNVRCVDYSAIHDYDGLLYGDSNQKWMWTGYDIETQTQNDICMTQNGYNMIAGAYCPEDGNIYGTIFLGTNGSGLVMCNAVLHGESLSSRAWGRNYQFDLDTMPVALAYSIADETMYGLSYSGRLFTVSRDLNMEATELGELSRGVPLNENFVTLAADNWGNLYAVDLNGVLYRIDPETLKAKVIGNTGLKNSNGYFCSLYYENVKNKLYMSFADDSNSGAIYEINTRTAEATLVMDNVGQVTSLFTYTPADFEPGPEPPEFLPGDVDQDGSITVADALLAMRYAMGIIDLTPEQLELAEMDGDGTVTISDALIIMRMAMGLIQNN